MSAMTNLAALFPPEGISVWNPNLPWQPIPVHTVPVSEDQVSVLGKPGDSIGPERTNAGCSVLVDPGVWTLLGLCSLNSFLNKGAKDSAEHRKPEAVESRNGISLCIFIWFCHSFNFRQFVPLCLHTPTHITHSSQCSAFNCFDGPHRVLLPLKYPKTSLPAQ